MPFPWSSCGWLLFGVNIGILNQPPAKSGVDLHETLWCSQNHQSLKQSRETSHPCAGTYDIWAGIRYWLGEWASMDPNYRRVGNFDIPERRKPPSKNDNIRQFDRTINLIVRKCYRSSAWVHTVRVEASLSSIWRRLAWLLTKLYRGGEVEENLEVLALLVIVWQCIGLSTQTQQSAHCISIH